MVHPNVPAIVIAPICPHSLSFRPIIVPAGVEIKVSHVLVASLVYLCVDCFLKEIYTTAVSQKHDNFKNKQKCNTVSIEA